jgi:hypothetical protein
MQASESDLWVFRDARSLVCGRVLVRQLQRSLDKLLEGSANEQELSAAIIQAGALESALADLGSAGTKSVAAVTDRLSAALFTHDPDSLQRAASALDHLMIPDTIPTSPPEGFSYYAVHPLDFVAAADNLPLSSFNVGVIGIRNIGTTLSAIVTAALKARGRNSSRITVRPNGHPYERSATFGNKQKDWIQEYLDRGSDFVVVDEGPGRSGSTFLSVGEALLQAAVPLDRITFLGTREVDPGELCAQDAANRWSKFRFRVARQVRLTDFKDYTYIGGGEWRKILFAERHWPESWPQMERLKFLSPDGTQIFKFEGMGPLGAAVRERSLRLAAAGFGPQIEAAQDGFSCYTVINGHPMSFAELTEDVLERIARYCAFRFSEFRAESNQCTSLPQMLESNLAREFHAELRKDSPILATELPALVDGRMQPYEWIRLPNGSILKTDGASHGDDHFFPGPTDITWDLAGAAVEWNLPPDAAAFLLSRFYQLTGKDPRPVFSMFKLAYAVFRVAWCKMAATTVSGTEEEIRLKNAYARYSACVRDELQRGGPEKSKSVNNRVVNNTSTAIFREEARQQARTQDSTPVLHDCSDCT